MASKRHAHGPIEARPRRRVHKDRGVQDSVTVERSKRKGMLIVFVDDSPFVYDGTDIAGWAMRIAVALNLPNLENLLTQLRKLER